jgi:hypothetical protein
MTRMLETVPTPCGIRFFLFLLAGFAFGQT